METLLLGFGAALILGYLLIKGGNWLRERERRNFRRAIVQERLKEMQNGRKNQDLTVPREIVS